MAVDPRVMTGNGHATQAVDEGTLRQKQLEAANAQKKAAKAARQTARAQRAAAIFSMTASIDQGEAAVAQEATANSQKVTAVAQEAAANAMRDAAIAQRDYFVALRTDMPAVPAPTPAPIVVQRNYQGVVAAAIFVMALAIGLLAAILAQGMITGRLFGPTPPPPPPAVTLPVVPTNTDAAALKRDVVGMFGGLVNEHELTVIGKSVAYNFNPEIHSIHFPTNFPMFAVVRPGWEIKDMDERLTFGPGEKHYFPQHSGSFVATKVVN